MLHYFKDEKGALRCVCGDLPIHDQKLARRTVEIEANIRPKTAILALVVDNPAIDRPIPA